jgi:hypothetical protein
MRARRRAAPRRRLHTYLGPRHFGFGPKKVTRDKLTAAGRGSCSLASAGVVMAESEELVTLRNSYFVGNYKGVVQEVCAVRVTKCARARRRSSGGAQAASLGALEGKAAVYRDAYLHRAHIAVGKTDLVFKGVDKSAAIGALRRVSRVRLARDSAVRAGLQAVKLLAQFTAASADEDRGAAPGSRRDGHGGVTVNAR